MSYLSQMAGLTVQNFVSAPPPASRWRWPWSAASRAPIAKGIGNFWADLVRATLYVLLPLSSCSRCSMSGRACRRTLSGYVEATTLEGAKQTIAQGPVASQLAIKMLGTNGGGFFNANSAHPYENPTALSNFVQMLTIFVIGAALTNVFGRMVGDERQGWAILAAMGVLFLAGVFVAYWAEAGGNPLHRGPRRRQSSGGNMEGKEVRFGIATSALFAMITTAASCGAVNAMHDSFMPLGGMVPLVNIMLGEVIVGGVGAGLYGMLLFAILAMFIAGLMVGRTPEYVGKKIEAREIKMTMLAILSLPLPILGFTARGGRRAGGPRRPGQCRPARLQRDPLCLHLGRRQQRQRLRRPHRPTRSSTTRTLAHRDAGRPLRRSSCRCWPSPARSPPSARPPASAGTFPTHGGAVRRPAGRRGADRGRPHLPAGAGARPDRRALRAARRHAVLRGAS